MQKRILIIDDDDDIREVAALTLEMVAGWNVVTANSGAHGIQRAQEENPDAILLDVMMPGMDGPTTLSELRKNRQTCEIPVVFMTARAQAREVEEFISLGAQGVISKPFDPMTLASQVEGHLQAVKRI
jgi:CheY-like chemotaxis protein